jgi:hypothetical protein
MATATQVITTESERMQNRELHTQYLEGQIIQIVKALCELSTLTGNPIDASEITVVFEDSVISDTATEKNQARMDVETGLLLPWEYRMRFMGESEEVAKQKIAEGKDDRNPFKISDYGDV